MQEQRQQYLDDSVVFKRNAVLLIHKMVEMASVTEENTSELVDEILHSIFFLGKITVPEFSPGDIFVDDVDLCYHLKKAYPEPFKRYSSSLPRRSPFSCVLDMVVHLKGQEHEDDIRKTLQKLVQELRRDASKNLLFSTTICISAGNSTNSVRHYGVSMSTTGRPAGQILIAASCLNFWEEHVANAVMSYNPDKSKKTYFDGTIQLPPDIRCEAFNLGSRDVTRPCLSCKDMFGLATTDTQRWPYGNCAEAESLSNLFSEKEVREQVQRKENWKEETAKKKKVKRAISNDLKEKLKKVGFTWDNEFYIAQRAKAVNYGKKEPLPCCCCCSSCGCLYKMKRRYKQ